MPCPLLPSKFQPGETVAHRRMFGRVTCVRFSVTGVVHYDVKFQDPTGVGMRTLKALDEDTLASTR